MSASSDDIEYMETFLRLVKRAVENLRQRNKAQEEVDDIQRLLDALAISFCPHCGSELTAEHLSQREN